MPEGTLRALGILVALFQTPPGQLGHPAAAEVLRDILRDGSERTQVVVTSHSPELLDDDGISADEILYVTSNRGVTEIGPLSSAGRDALSDHLYTAGELLRVNQLSGDAAGLPSDQSLQAW